MKLESVRVRNFRGYADATIRVDDLTALVGRNDAGKSTVLEALAIFFESNGAKIEAADLNKFGMGETIEIRCTFGDLPEGLVIDEAAPTTLADEYLLNPAGKLEIAKRWKIGGRITTEIFAHALHPSAKGIDDLLGLKIDLLKKRVDEQNLAVEDKRRSPLLRKALRDAVADKKLAPMDISLDDGDGKKVWDKLERELPLYVLFKADRSTSDEDAEAQDPMKLAVRDALRAVEADLERIEAKVRASVEEVATRTVAELKKIDAGLAALLVPEFKTDRKWDGLFKLSLMGDKEIPLNKRGSGVKRLVLLGFLLGEIERRREAEARSSVIVAVEEPETALHPKQQALLVESLRRLSEAPDTQVLLTTHSPALSALLPYESLRLITRAGADAVAQVDHGPETPARVAEELGVLPDPARNGVRVLVCVEGPTDAAFLVRATTLLRAEDAAIPDLERDPRIVVFPLGGGTLKHWVENRYLRKLNVPEVHIYDRDDRQPPPYEAAVEAVKARGDGSTGFLTKKRELENYYPPEAIEAALGESIARNELTSTCDVCMVLAPPIYEAKNGKPWAGAGEKLRKNCAERLKDRLAKSIVDALSAEGLRASGFLDELKEWMEPVNRAVKGTTTGVATPSHVSAVGAEVGA